MQKIAALRWKMHKWDSFFRLSQNYIFGDTMFGSGTGEYISECTGLDPAWDKIKTEAKFPIVFGTLVQVICDPGYELKGSNTIVCDRDTTFNFVEQPACKELGKWLRHCV